MTVDGYGIHVSSGNFFISTCLWLVYSFFSSFGVASVRISGYSSFTPGSQTNFGQQYGNGADLFVLSVSNLQRSLAIGNGPQSSTSSWSLFVMEDKRNLMSKWVCCFSIWHGHHDRYLLGWSLATTQVERPQNGVSSHVLPGSTVAQRVEAKHMPGKSKIQKKKKMKSYSRTYWHNVEFITVCERAS